MNLFDVVVARKLAGGSGGGGGSSDFSTAEVTVVNNTDDFISFLIPSVFEENAMGEGSPACVYEIPLYPSDNESVSTTVPLYKGSILVDNLFTDQTITISGNAEMSLDGVMFKITGDCTITIS